MFIFYKIKDFIEFHLVREFNLQQKNYMRIMWKLYENKLRTNALN